MWNPSAAGLIALRAAANILKAKLDQMIVRMIETARDGDACSSNGADASLARSAPTRVAPASAPAVEAADAATLAKPLRPIPWAEIGGLHHRAPPPDNLANVDDKSFETYDRLVYAMGCPGLRGLSRELGITVWKIGTCHNLRPRPRQDALSN